MEDIHLVSLEIYEQYPYLRVQFSKRMEKIRSITINLSRHLQTYKQVTINVHLDDSNLVWRYIYRCIFSSKVLVGWWCIV